MTGRLRIIRTAFFRRVAELRRLLISPDRLREGTGISLKTSELHYIRRVLRLRPGDSIAVVDGLGHLWTAELLPDGVIQRDHDSMISELPPRPRLGLGLSLIRRGFDDALRMACELGVDVIQPLRCQRCVPGVELRPERWETVLNEAMEQCERLWSPRLESDLTLEAWLPTVQGCLAFGHTRCSDAMSLTQWLKTIAPADRATTIWLIIGPEGGWTSPEMESLDQNAAVPVQLGETILRSATAAVAGSVEMVRWRESLFTS